MNIVWIPQPYIFPQNMFRNHNSQTYVSQSVRFPPQVTGNRCLLDHHMDMVKQSRKFK